jgi:hypothetical protein
MMCRRVIAIGFSCAALEQKPEARSKKKDLSRRISSSGF